jgi:hypothetical protein
VLLSRSTWPRRSNGTSSRCMLSHGLRLMSNWVHWQFTCTHQSALQPKPMHVSVGQRGGGAKAAVRGIGYTSLAYLHTSHVTLPCSQSLCTLVGGTRGGVFVCVGGGGYGVVIGRLLAGP